MSQCQNINYLHRKIILNCTLTCLQAVTQNNSFFPLLLPQLNYRLDEFIFASLPMSQNKSVWMSTRWWLWYYCSAGDNHVWAPPPQSPDSPDTGWPQVLGVRPDLSQPLSVSGAYLDDDQQRSFTAKCQSRHWLEMTSTYRGVETDLAGVMTLASCVYRDEDQMRGLTPGVSLGVVSDLIKCNIEFLSETISVATNLRSNNEFIEWSKNILEGLI